MACYTPSRLDYSVAKILGIKPSMVSAIRGMYDEERQKQGSQTLDQELNIDINNLKGADATNAARALVQYRSDKAKERAQSINKSGKARGLAPALQKLRDTFTTKEKENRINMIAAMFSTVVDQHVAANPGVPRQAIIKGFKSGDQYYAGQFALFNTVYDRLFKRWTAHMEAASDEYNSAYIAAAEKGIKDAFAYDASQRDSFEMPFFASDYAKGLFNDGKDAEFKRQLIYDAASKFGIHEPTLSSQQDILDAMRTQQRIKQNDHAERADKYLEVLENFPELCTYAKLKLRDTEGLKLGADKDYAADTNLDNYGDNEIAQLFNASESRREGWQEEDDKKSAFGSCGYRTRRFLSTIPARDPETGVILRDDLGYTIFMDPMRAHRILGSHLYGMRSETSMMEELESMAKSYAWVGDCRAALMRDESLRTCVLVDMAKSFQPYSQLIKSAKDSIGRVKKYILKLLNQRPNSLLGNYLRDVKMNRVYINPTSSGPTMFNARTGKLDVGPRIKDLLGGGLKESLEYLKEWFGDYGEQKEEGKKEENQNIFAGANIYRRTGSEIPLYYQRSTTYATKKKVLMTAARAFGIYLSPDVAANIIADKKVERKFTKLLQQLAFEGVTPQFTVAQMKNLREGDGSLLANVDWERIVHSVRGRDQKAIFKEKAKAIFEIIYNAGEGLGMEDRVKYKDRKGNTITLYSNVSPSYLSDKLEAIKRFVEKDDKIGLKNYLEQQFFTCPIFYDKQTGEILNSWLREIYECCNDDRTALSDSFAAQFAFRKNLGSDSSTFEDFTSKQHAIDLLLEYNADAEINKNKGKTALYPTFILGDANVSKYIRARRYTEEEALENMYDVYKQEKKRMQLVAATNEWMDRQGYVRLNNFSKTADRYTMLPFLNADYIALDGTVGKYALPENPSKEDVLNAIKAYITDSTEDFKKRLDTYGVLETTIPNDIWRRLPNKKTYCLISQFADPSNIDQKLRDFILNSKLAMINQLQMMIVDVAFFQNTKDLQYNYRAIHISGKPLCIDAKWDGINVFGRWAKERCIYFDDISLPPRAEFMTAVEKRFGKKSATSMYAKNTLTDGQGYRSLSSYRKVKIGAGEWSRDDENAYKAILEYRAKLREGNLTEEQKRDYIEKISSLAVTFMPIKPYLFTHERLRINIYTFILIPVQHMYREAILIPELLPEGCMLRHLGEYMEDNSIDLVISTKCVKVGNWGQTSLTEVQSKEQLYTALRKGTIHALDYSDIRLQIQDIKNIINIKQLFGTQIRKLIMFGIKLGDSNYTRYLDSRTIVGGGNGMVNIGKGMEQVRLSGRNLISFYNSLITANILQSFKQVESILKDTDETSMRLIQSILSNSREAVDNILAFSMTEDERFLIPLFEGAVEHDSMALLLSIFRKLVNKQTIKGGSAVQVSAMGITGYEEDGGLAYVACDKDGNEIRFTGNESPEELAALKERITNIKYVECELPWDLTYVDDNGNEVALDYNKYCNLDGTLKPNPDGPGSLLERDYPKITDMIAYRIPTERAYSMLNLKVTRFSQKTAGGTIRVPVQGTTIAGFDFDIDKLYFMRRAYDENGLVQYNTEFSALGNSKEARDNMLLDLIQARLEDEETFEARYTPGGFANASESARVMRELEFGDLTGAKNSDGSINLAELERRHKDDTTIDPEPNYDPSDPATLLIYNQQNQIAAKLIGIFANHNTNHAFATLMSTFKLKSPIAFAGQSFGDLLHAPKDRYPDLTMAEFLASSVDAVKDPVLNFLNFNTITANSAALLGRLGYNTTEIGLLLNQPIIKAVCERCLNDGLPLDNVISAVFRELTQGDTLKRALSDYPSSPTDFTVNKLVEGVLSGRKIREDNRKVIDVLSEDENLRNQQIKVLKLFQEIATAAEELGQFVSATKFTAANSVGSTAGALYEQQMRVANYLEKLNAGEKASKFEIVIVDDAGYKLTTPVQNGEEQLDMNDADYLHFIQRNPFAFEQAMYDMNRRVIRLLSKYYPYSHPIYAKIRKNAAELTKHKVLKGATIDSMHRDFLAYVLNQQEGSLFCGGNLITTMDGNLMPIRDYYREVFPDRILEFIKTNPDIRDNYAILRLLDGRYDKDSGELLGLKISYEQNLTNYTRDEIMDSWSDLAVFYPEIAQDLFFYNFHTSGFQFTPFSFMHLAPADLKSKIIIPTAEDSQATYADFLYNFLDHTDWSALDEGYDFIKQWVLNHPDNYEFVFEVRTKVLQDYFKNMPIIYQNDYVNSFVIDLGSEETKKAGVENFIIRQEKSDDTVQFFFKPFIKIRDKIYMAAGTDGDSSFISSTNGTMRYVLVETLGEKGKTTKYHKEYSIVWGENTRALPEETENPQLFAEYDFGVNPDSESMINMVEDRTDELREILINAIIKGKTVEGDLYYSDPQHLQELKQELENASETELQMLVERIQTACRKDGVLMLSQRGELQYR